MTRLPSHSLRFLAVVAAASAVAIAVCAGSASATRGATGGRNVTVVGYSSLKALRRAVARSDARVIRRIPKLHAAVLQTPPAALGLLDRLGGIRYAEQPAARYSLDDPAIAPAPAPGGAYEWQWTATNQDLVPLAVRQAAANVTIAVIDSGADVTAPDLAAKAPTTWSVVSNSADVSDRVGHGTFVSSLAAGSSTNVEGVAGFGGDAKLLVIQAGGALFSTTEVAEALVFAVDRGAKVINLSLGGEQFSGVEQDALDYAFSHGALVIAAAGNSGDDGNPPIYPAAYLQPLGSNGIGGSGLAVGATSLSGARASFSSFGSFLSLAAPGEHVFGAVSADADPSEWSPTTLPGSTAGIYGYSSGTSFAAPEVTGAAALVWAANPQLSPPDVARILKETASGRGSWNPETGYGILDAAAAVERAQSVVVPPQTVTLNGARDGNHVKLTWSAPNATRYRLDVSRDGAASQILLGASTSTSVSTDVEPGHTYSFTVTATTAWGSSYSSAAYTLTLPYSPVKVSLRGARIGGKTSRRVQLWAIFAPAKAGFGRGGRTIALEAYDGRVWRRFARVSTKSTGVAAWKGTVRRGTYLLRAAYAGAEDLAPAKSAALKFRFR